MPLQTYGTSLVLIQAMNSDGTPGPICGGNTLRELRQENGSLLIPAAYNELNDLYELIELSKDEILIEIRRRMIEWTVIFLTSVSTPIS